MIVEYATTESFAAVRRTESPIALQETAFTSRLRLGGLPPGRTIFYRIAYADLADTSATSDWVLGPLPYAFRGRSRCELRLVGRYGWTGLGHQPRHRRA